MDKLQWFQSIHKSMPSCHGIKIRGSSDEKSQNQSIILKHAALIAYIFLYSFCIIRFGSKQTLVTGQLTLAIMSIKG